MEYLNFDIRIVSSHPYLVLADQPELGEAQEVLELIPDSSEFRDALLQLEKRQTNNTSLEEFGKLLYEKLFAGKIGTQFHEAVGFARGSDKMGVRIRLRISASELSPIPWELLCDPTRSFLGTDIKSPVIRWLSVAQPIRKMRASLPLRMLVAIPEISEPYQPLEVDREVNALRKTCENMKGEVELSILNADVSLDRIEATLLVQPYQVIHFIGHGKFQEDQGALLLNSSKGAMEWVNEHRLAEMLKNHPDLKLIVLNACEGATVTASRAFSGVGPNLVRAGIPAVIAMQYPVYDEAAIIFAEKFYHALFRNSNVGRVDCAMVYARSALFRELPDEREFATPVLFLRAPEGVLFYKFSGKRFQDAAFSEAAVHTEKAIGRTYAYNQSLAQDSSALQNQNLLEHIEADKHEYEYLKKRVSFSRRIVTASTLTFVLVFLFFCVGLFDLFRLDTLLEGLTLAAGNTVAERSGPEDVMIVATDDAINVSWRKKHGLLVTRLAEAGAKVVVFDMTFEPQEALEIAPATQAFAQAVAAARQRGTDIVLGFRELRDRRPDIEEKLWNILGPSGVGAICLSSKLNFVTIVPLLIKKTTPDGEEQKSYPSLALAAFFAARGVVDHMVDFQENRINLVPLAKGFLPFSQKRNSIGSECGANERGDVNADLFIDLTPVDFIRDELRTVSYREVISGESVVEQPDLFRGKVIFVGERSKRERFAVFDFNHATRFGVELHADAYKTIQRSNSGEAIVRPLSFGPQALLILTLTFLGGSIRLWVVPSMVRWRMVLLIIIPLAYTAGVFWLCVSHRLIIDWLYHLAGFFFAYILSGRVEKRWS